MNKDVLYPMSKTADFLTQELDNELLLYNLKTNQTFCLNETAALVWQKADGKSSVTDITAELSNNFACKISDEFVWITLVNLAKKGLMKNVPVDPTPLSDRREMIKRIGLGTMVALPLISTLIAPAAIRASSTCAAPGFDLFLGQKCGLDNGNDCGCSSFANASKCCSGRSSATSACTARDPCSCLCDA
jgi:hypothetical protein